MPPLRSPVRARAMLRMQRGHACGARAHAAGFRRNGRGGVVRRRRRAHGAHLERRRRETPGTRDGTAHAAPGAARMACKRGSGAHTRERRRTPPTWVRPRPGACMHSRRSGGDPRDRSAGTAPHVRPARTRPARAHRQPVRPFPNAARRNGSCPHPAHRRRVHHRLHHERCLRRPSRGGRGRAALRGVRSRLANAPMPRPNAPAPRINKGFRAFPRFAFPRIAKAALSATPKQTRSNGPPPGAAEQTSTKLGGLKHRNNLGTPAPAHTEPRPQCKKSGPKAAFPNPYAVLP